MILTYRPIRCAVDKSIGIKFIELNIIGLGLFLKSILCLLIKCHYSLDFYLFYFDQMPVKRSASPSLPPGRWSGPIDETSDLRMMDRPNPARTPAADFRMTERPNPAQSYSSDSRMTGRPNPTKSSARECVCHRPLGRVCCIYCGTLVSGVSKICQIDHRLL